MRPALSPFAREKLAELATSSRCRPEAVAALRRLLEKGTDIDCYKVNVYRFAAERGLARPESLRLFLFAARLGLFDMHFDVHCPSCRGLPEFYRHLMGLRNKAHCLMCGLEIGVDFESNVEVTFTPSPEARRIRFQHYKDRDFDGRLKYYGEIVAREGRAAVVGRCFDPGEKGVLRALLEPGEYTADVPGYPQHSVPVTVAGDPVGGVQSVRVMVDRRGRPHLDRTRLRPGAVDFHVEYRFPRFWGWGLKGRSPLKNWVSAAYVTSQQDFADLFSGEFLAPDVSFAVKHVALLFTDIKASTRMYERLGDGRAYAVVQDHFRLMADVIRAREGRIVKTIGDAVMASFPKAEDAARAAVEIQRSFLRARRAGLDVEVKLGLHAGSAIAVTSNRALDYFGRAVNIAARVQGESAGGEIVATEAIVRDPQARAALAGLSVGARPFDARLKGIAGRQRLYKLRWR